MQEKFVESDLEMPWKGLVLRLALMMLHTDDRRLIRISIQTICYQGWSETIDAGVIEFVHLPDGIAVTTDRYTHPIRRRVYERVITNLRLSA